MKKLLMLMAGFCLITCANTKPPQTVKLNEPSKNRGESTMKALENRKSTREFADRKLSLQDLSDLIWAANGYNRPTEEKRTAGTAMNKQEIDIYVILEEGAYLYDAKNHELTLVVAEDLRPHIAANQEFAKTAPVCLLIVADMERAGGNDERTRNWTALDAGIVSQNISLFCAGCGFATVPRGFMDKEALATALGFTDKQFIHLNHPVGYFKE